jgi:hypothetical protein
MNIHPVQTRQDMRAFLGLPYQLYREDPVWVPPLRDDQRKQFEPAHNPFL